MRISSGAKPVAQSFLGRTIFHIIALLHRRIENYFTVL
jgi:hypothetical protein